MSNGTAGGRPAIRKARPEVSQAPRRGCLELEPALWEPSPILPRSTVLTRRYAVNAIIYLVGLVVVIMFVLSFLGLR